MTDDENQELDRLCALLGRIAEKITDPAEIEALKKAAVALHVAYFHGHTADIEDQFSAIGRPLSNSEESHLRSMGIEI